MRLRLARQASSPVFFGRPRAGPLSSATTALEKYRGRAGHHWARWTHGPRRLATSRLVEVRIPAFFVKTGEPQVRQSLGVPRAVFEVCSASPPVDLPFRLPPLRQDAYPPLLAQVVAALCDRTQRDAITGPVDARSARRDECGLDRRAASPHLQRSVVIPATAPRPASEDACADTPR
jgi:hypothetical protein